VKVEDHLPQRLAALGLRDLEQVVTHTNRTVMLSLSRRVLRIHRGYAFASDRVLKAIVRFLSPRVPRALRRAAEREFLEFPVHAYVTAPERPPRRDRARVGDVALLHRLELLHRRFNALHFGGTLGDISIRLSGRMKSRLGEVALDLETGRPMEIGISRRHIARHSWSEVEHTLLHEMVHQWQAETGLRVDHGPGFRRKAREVGVLPAAKRRVSGAARQLASILVLLLSSLGVSTGWSQGSRTPLVVTHLDHDLLGLNGLDGPVRTVIRSPDQWKRFWMAQQLPTFAELPSGADYTREMVILAAADVAPWNSIGTRIDSVWLKRDTVIVQIDLYRCSAPAVGSPIDAVVVRPAGLPVRFIEPAGVRKCD
jgi:SprT-like family protein